MGVRRDSYFSVVPLAGGGSSPGGPAGGDLTGTYPNPQVDRLTGAGGTVTIANGTVIDHVINGEIINCSGGLTVFGNGTYAGSTWMRGAVAIALISGGDIALQGGAAGTSVITMGNVFVSAFSFLLPVAGGTARIRIAESVAGEISFAQAVTNNAGLDLNIIGQEAKAGAGPTGNGGNVVINGGANTGGSDGDVHIAVTRGRLRVGPATGGVGGAGPTATLGQTGGAGQPAGAAQTGWLQIKDVAGATRYLPVWT